MRGKQYLVRDSSTQTSATVVLDIVYNEDTNTGRPEVRWTCTCDKAAKSSVACSDVLAAVEHLQRHDVDITVKDLLPSWVLLSTFVDAQNSVDNVFTTDQLVQDRSKVWWYSNIARGRRRKKRLQSNTMTAQMHVAAGKNLAKSGVLSQSSYESRVLGLAPNGQSSSSATSVPPQARPTTESPLPPSPPTPPVPVPLPSATQPVYSVSASKSSLPPASLTPHTPLPSAICNASDSKQFSKLHSAASLASLFGGSGRNGKTVK